MITNNTLWLDVNSVVMFVSFVFLIVYLRGIVERKIINLIMANIVAIPTA
jgi:hypothetical protein